MAEQVEDAAEVLLREENFVISDNDFKGYCHPFSFVERVDSELQEESLRILALYLFAVLYEVKGFFAISGGEPSPLFVKLSWAKFKKEHTYTQIREKVLSLSSSDIVATTELFYAALRESFPSWKELRQPSHSLMMEFRQQEITPSFGPQASRFLTNASYLSSFEHLLVVYLLELSQGAWNRLRPAASADVAESFDEKIGARLAVLLAEKIPLSAKMFAELTNSEGALCSFIKEALEKRTVVGTFNEGPYEDPCGLVLATARHIKKCLRLWISGLDKVSHEAKDTFSTSLTLSVASPTALSDCNQGTLARTYFSPYLALCQSSGSGKTKLVFALSPHFFVIYVCLRPAKADAVPNRTPLFADLLEGCKSQSDSMRALQ